MTDKVENANTIAAQLDALREELEAIRNAKEDELPKLLLTGVSGNFADLKTGGIELDEARSPKLTTPSCISGPKDRTKDMTEEEMDRYKAEVKDHFPKHCTVVEVTTKEGYKTLAIQGVTSDQANAICEKIDKVAALEKEEKAKAQATEKSAPDILNPDMLEARVKELAEKHGNDGKGAPSTDDQPSAGLTVAYKAPKVVPLGKTAAVIRA